MKLTAVRLMDATLLFCLFYGHFHAFTSTETFAIIVIASMVIMAVLGCFAMTEELAMALFDKSSVRKAFGYLVCGLYVAVLVITDHPLLAAAYFIVFSWLYVSAHSKMKEVSK